jgi:hypothetical protein
MAYMSQEKKQKIAAKVKPILSKYGVKGSLSVHNRSTIVLTLKEGKLDFIGDLSDERNSALGHYQIDKDKLRESYNLDVNVYWYQEHYTGKSKDFLSELIPAMKSADWYDRSDIQTDYFDTAYYVDVNVGKWNKPYTLTK